MEGSSENEDFIPSTDSNDPSARKLARQLRIKARLEAAKRLKSTLDNSSRNLQEENKSPLLQTIDHSNEKLFQIFVEGKELVTNIRVASDSREIERRDEDVAARNARLQKLEDEAALAMEKLQDISTKWDTIKISNDPLDLHQELKDQKARCLELINQKDSLIADFKEELKGADERFMSDRENMFEDISMLAKRVDEQVSVMKGSYFAELENIEEAIDNARTEVLNERQSEWEKLYQQRETDEVDNMNNKFAVAQANNEEIRQEHIKHEEKFRETKIRIENDVQALEQELEQVKVRCLINSEKLDYNYQILKKREDENVIIKSHQKRTLIKLQEEFMNLKKKVDEANKVTESEMKRLDKELCRYHTNVIDIEKKADHFSNVNNSKFLKIWDMKTQEANCLLDKILAAEKIVHEQILDLDWGPPNLPRLKKEDLPSYQAAVAIVDDIIREDDVVGPPMANTIEKISIAETDGVLKEILTLIADEAGFLVEERLEQLLEPYTENEKTIVRLETVFSAIGVQRTEDVELLKDYFLQYAVCNVCSGTSRDSKTKLAGAVHLLENFKLVQEDLTSSRTRSSENIEILGEEQYDEEHLHGPVVHIWEGFDDAEEVPGEEGLSIPWTHSSEGIEALQQEQVQEDLVSPVVPSSDGIELDDETEGGLRPIVCSHGHPLSIQRIFVLKALRDFVLKLHAPKFRERIDAEVHLAKHRCTISRLVSQKDMQGYWDQYTNIFPEDSERNWDALNEALTKYHAILQERQKINDKVQKLRQQNMELRSLVSKYVPLCNAKKFGLLPPEKNLVFDD